LQWDLVKIIPKRLAGYLGERIGLYVHLYTFM